MRLFRPGFYAGWFYPEVLFRIKTDEMTLCLTFDDGPDPVSTPQILEILARHKTKAIFFCNGKDAEKYPEIVNAIASDGHVIGNHGYDHPDGWSTSLKGYLENIAKAAPFTSDKLFRPPYGHLRLNQYRKLKNIYKIVLWDIMPYDFDNKFGKEKALSLIKKRIRPGSVIVLHDTQNSSAISILDSFIEYSLKRGYRFILPEFV
jgi:peptidoglycan/xylan/chitin deacetylase (PgdA/CDA1 family)